MTGRITIDLFVTLDGVAQAPGGPEEDASGGFPWGGWQAPFEDAVIGQRIGDGIRGLDALLLGRRTYDIFAAYWPQHTGGEVGFIGQKFDEVPKYVASRGTPELRWKGSSLLGPDIVLEVERLRSQHDDIHVIGSVDLAQTLLAEQLYDELVLWTYPIVLGEGKKVFPNGATPSRMSLVGAPLPGPTGVVELRYAPAGRPTTGDMT
jgi:dihydrofolate reductase